METVTIEVTSVRAAEGRRRGQRRSRRGWKRLLRELSWMRVLHYWLPSQRPFEEAVASAKTVEIGSVVKCIKSLSR